MLQSLPIDLVDRSFDCGLSVVPMALLKFTVASAVEVDFRCAVRWAWQLLLKGWDCRQLTLWPGCHRIVCNCTNAQVLKPFLISLLYVSSCVLALLQAMRESTPQPIGLLIVVMVMTPVLVSIIAGLPVNCMSFQNKQAD